MTILERLRAATGPDRELDAEIMFDLFAKPVGQKKDGGPAGYLWPEDNPSWNFGIRFPSSTKEQILASRKYVDGETLIIERDRGNVLMNPIRMPELTASIDSALALVERMLPDAAYDLHKSDNGYSFSILRADLDRPYFSGATPALAILTALFAALEVQEKK